MLIFLVFVVVVIGVVVFVFLIDFVRVGFGFSVDGDFLDWMVLDW